MSSTSNREQGLTLLEVMVALLIFALTATSVMKAATEHLRGVGVLEDVTFATWVANNQMTGVLLDETWPPKNNDKGNTEMAGRTWYWQQRVTSTADNDMRNVEIIVSTDEAGENVVTSINTFIAQPSQGNANADSR